MALTSQVDSTTIAPIAMGANIASAALDATPYLNLSIQYVWAGATGTINATVQGQVSNDGVNFVNYLTPVPVSGASGTAFLDLGGAASASEFNARFYRVNYTAGTTTGGTLTSFICMKKNP